MVLSFTDVQNSTKLWSTKPADMKLALRVHNQMMRSLIKKYNGYEVKTQGDSFMVCFCDCWSAVKWACDVQKCLIDCDWPANILDSFDCRVEWDSERRKIFRGLRVRIGLHYGEAERIIDSTTNRPDYFGNTVNTAARVESEAKGGQVYISEHLFEVVKDQLIDLKSIQPDAIKLPTASDMEQRTGQENVPPTFVISNFEESESLVDGPKNNLFVTPSTPHLSKYALTNDESSAEVDDFLPETMDDQILYDLAGSYELKGLQDKYYCLRERKYDDTKKEEEDHHKASNKSGENTRRSSKHTSRRGSSLSRFGSKSSLAGSLLGDDLLSNPSTPVVAKTKGKQVLPV
ncbi:adenylate cyclase [Acrasis kona]|uniref:Adenylate cyclase n=1 Tax=Acrasis kona TaxID=1008807 RepID=A0AAW2Z5S9_9EUKA